MEIKRVLLNKKLIAVFLLIIAVCTGFYINNEYHSGKNDDDIFDQLSYINSFDKYLESIDEKADSLNSVSIFSENDSFSRKNITKTAEDYKNLKGIELTIVKDKPITSVMNFSLAHYLVLLMSFVTVFKFLEERKRGLQNLIFSTPKGRTILASKRCAVLTVTVISTNIAVYASLFAVSFFIYGGAEDLFRNIQSIEMFKNFIFPMSELQFIALYVLINILTQLSIGFFILFVFSSVQNNVLCFGVLGLVSGIEFLLYTFIPIQSNLALMKCVNIFYLINPTEAIIKYTNLNSGFSVISLFSLIIFVAVVSVLCFVLLTIFVCSRKFPQRTLSRATQFIIIFFEKSKSLYWRAVERLGIIGTELYKMLIIQKGIIVLAVFTIVLLNVVNTNEVIYSGSDSIVNRFYENYGGEVSADALKYIEDTEKKIADIDKEISNAAKKFNSGRITRDEYDDAIIKGYAYDSERDALAVINERLDYISLQKELDNEVWLVNPIGYERLLGSDGYSRQFDFALLEIFCIVIVLSGVFAFETKALASDSIKSSCRGREYLFNKKMLSAGVITLAVWIISGVAELYSVAVRFPLAELHAPIKSLPFMQGVPFNMSIVIFLAFLYIMRLVLLLSVASIICMISSFTKFEISIVVSFAFVIMPSILYILGIKVFAYFSFVYPIAMMNLILDSNGFSFVIPMLLIIILGFLSVLVAKRRWCSSRR